MRLTRDGLSAHRELARRVGTVRNRCERIHNNINPQQLRYRQREGNADKRTNQSAGQGDEVHRKLEL